MGKLFYIEFGKPDLESGWIVIGGSGLDAVYVVAESFDEAANKALKHIEGKVERKSIIDSNGDLDLSDHQVLIKSIKVATHEVVW